MTETAKAEFPIAILVNPRSGRGKAVKTGNWIAKELTERNIMFVIFRNSWPEELINFREVWIVGGDGTVNYFLNQYKKIPIPLAIFKGGTGNDFAWKLYGNRDIHRQLDLVLNASARPVDAAQCNGLLYVNSLGIGFDGEVLRSMGHVRRFGGHMGYLWAVVRNIFSYKERSFTITHGNTDLTGKFLLVIVNNSSRTGGGFLVAPNASIDDGKLDMVLCRPLHLLNRLRYLPVIEKGDHLQLDFIEYSCPKEVSIVCEKESYAQLDGELFSSMSFNIKVLPGWMMVKY